MSAPLHNMDYMKSFGVDLKEKKYHEEAVYAIALLYNTLQNRVSDYLKQYTLTVGKLNILVAARHQGGREGISQVEISRHLIVTAGNMTKLLDKLEKEGLVTRSPQKGDRRVNIIKVTKKAEILLDQLWPGYLEALAAVAPKFNKAKQKDLSYSLIKWLEDISN